MSVRDFIRRAREAGHDALGVANDEEWPTMGVRQCDACGRFTPAPGDVCPGCLVSGRLKPSTLAAATSDAEQRTVSAIAAWLERDAKLTPSAPTRVLMTVLAAEIRRGDWRTP